MLFQNLGDFVILENGNTTCVGKIRSSDEYILNVQNLINESPKEQYFESEIEMNDIYKDLKIMGYDYGPNFRGLRRIMTNDFDTFHGQVQWEGNWVTFMDSLLQTMAVVMPFRKMMVPVMIKQLRCDPKVLYQAVAANKADLKPPKGFDKEKLMDEMNKADSEEETDKDFVTIFEQSKGQVVDDINSHDFHFYKSMISFYLSMSSRMIVAPGIEVEDMMALPIPRKINIGDLKLESYEFIANEDYNSFEECDKINILEYLKVCLLFI